MLINAFVALVCMTLIIYMNFSLWMLGALLFIFGFSTGAFMLGFALGRELNKITVAATIIALINTTRRYYFQCVNSAIDRKIIRWSWAWQIDIRCAFLLFNY